MLGIHFFLYSGKKKSLVYLFMYVFFMFALYLFVDGMSSTDGESVI